MTSEWKEIYYLLLNFTTIYYLSDFTTLLPCRHPDTVQCYHINKTINKGKHTLDAYFVGGMKRHRKPSRRDKERLGTPVS